MPDWVRKQGASAAHPLEAILQDASGPVDLPVGTTVRLRAKLPGAATAKIDADAQVVSAGAAVGNVDRGRVRYTPNSADLDTPGIFDVDFLANVFGLGEQVFPEDGYLQLLVLPIASSL